MTLEDILNFIKNMCLHNVSIHTNFYQNRFINECARKKKAKIPEFHRFIVSQFHSFFVRCRRTYFLNKIEIIVSFTANLMILIVNNHREI